ncbi:TPR repeat-containing protein [Algoriphagus hitonicola]|uniref:TPR repeat-containing protein n=1 Tax=Algoriphagus hitonicola TaxID=435880 RepID=A0A1I2RHD2_9BACT|nr:tetratricopeptide repeat protein [Algoriphagus hitonicola]SFG39912.1 TPR repeat-containing protein [Algoriphagus hitonicola]
MKLSIRAGITLLFSMALLACSNSDQNQADTYYNDGDYDQAVVAYTEKLKNNPKDVSTLYSRGRAYEEAGNFEEAKSDFEQALKIDPNNFQILLSLSNVYHTTENYTNALLYANRAEEISGAPAMASFLKGRAYHSLGNTEEALKAYGSAIRRDKNFGQAYYNRGLLKVAMGNIGSACEDLQLASGLEYPGSSEAFAKYCQ